MNIDWSSETPAWAPAHKDPDTKNYASDNDAKTLVPPKFAFCLKITDVGRFSVAGVIRQTMPVSDGALQRCAS